MPSTLVLSDVGDETWGAVLEDGRVAELHVENRCRPGIAGNIYKGRVGRVLPGMQSAFIDIGIERDAFLHVSDLPGAASGEYVFEADDEEEPGESRTSPEAGEAAEPAGPRRGAPSVPRVEELIREGQEIVVQVSKETISTKGPRVTALVALPGRVLVYLPYIDRVFVSRRVEDSAERDRLAELARGAGGGGGWIVRTAAEGGVASIFERDAAYLRNLWAAIGEKECGAAAPALLHRDLDLAGRLHRDVVSEEFREIVVDSDRLERISTGFLASYLAGFDVRARRVEKGWALFDDLGIHQEIERALGPRIWLKSGGSIVVNPTEALVAIDVNTSKYVGKNGLEETALRTNLEAVPEIVRLLRVRDLGGIVVIDFIDMTEPQNRETLSQALREELRKDRSRSRLLAMSDFGLVQLTRKRTRRSLDRRLLVACPTCNGGGRIRSAIALYYEIQRELARGAPLGGPDAPLVRIHPAALARLEEEGMRLRVPRAGSTPPPAGISDPELSDSLPPQLVVDPSLPEDGYAVRW